MFYGGDRARIDEWLRVFPPYFKTLERIDLSGWHCMRVINRNTRIKSSMQIDDRFKEVLPEAVGTFTLVVMMVMILLMVMMMIVMTMMMITMKMMKMMAMSD
jgi:hypothetical protein